MIPYKDENPTHHIPFVTYSIIALNILAWIFVQKYGSEPELSESICRYGIIPGAVLGSGALDVSENICRVGHQSWITAVTSMFMHGGWMHLIANMWFLWIFADNIEDVLGPVKFTLFYLTGGIAAIAAQILADGGSLIPMVGASGAIGGVMGAYAWLYPTVRVHIAIILGFLGAYWWISGRFCFNPTYLQKAPLSTKINLESDVCFLEPMPRTYS
jgi:membrane associated rhomboid family serine protease